VTKIKKKLIEAAMRKLKRINEDDRILFAGIPKLPAWKYSITKILHRSLKYSKISMRFATKLFL
jgi:hypothetical protein